MNRSKQTTSDDANSSSSKNHLKATTETHQSNTTATCLPTKAKGVISTWKDAKNSGCSSKNLHRNASNQSLSKSVLQGKNNSQKVIETQLVTIDRLENEIQTFVNTIFAYKEQQKTMGSLSQ